MAAPFIVIDSSVALKWRLGDEEHVEQAVALIRDLSFMRLRVIVPTLFDYEIANALKTAEMRGRIPKEAAASALSDFESLVIERVGNTKLRKDALSIAIRHQRSVYDASYVALAQSLGIWFFTGDRRLYSGVSKELPWVRWIGDYDLSMIPL